ncbi:hypothetical protein ACIBHX_46800 [Nonomuraea sp. NPDC050536]|uniref:hypothetical protein n=1 Tax=Nonomuraea sp. NPDC050536 TaxID=3364366 RepID=UPI0037C6CAFD
MKTIFKRIVHLDLSRGQKLSVVMAIVAVLVSGGFLAFADDMVPPGPPAADQAPPAPTGKLPSRPSLAPVRWCEELGMFVEERYKLGKGCKRQIDCMIDPSTRKYRCQNSAGAAVRPPQSACLNPGIRPFYACDGDPGSVHVATMQPDNAATSPPPAPAQSFSTVPALTNPNPSPGASAPPAASAPPTAPAASAGPSPTAAASSSTLAALQAARAVQPPVRIWVEHDLSGDYQRGDAAFQVGLQALIATAQQPDVVGVKFADNLGYVAGQNGWRDQEQVRQFVRAASSALRTALPGKRLAIGVAVPELGCGANTSCVQAMQSRAPLAAKQAIGDYLAAAPVDRVEIADGLWGPSYTQFKITPAAATRSQWQAIRALRWSSQRQVTSRQYGLAHKGEASTWDQANATAQVNTRVIDLLNRYQVPTITLWGHKSALGDGVYRLLNAGLAPNPLWTALGSKGLRDRLAVVVDPVSTERSLAADLAELGKVASEVFILT